MRRVAPSRISEDITSIAQRSLFNCTTDSHTDRHTRVAAATHRAEHRHAQRRYTVTARHLTAKLWPCVCRRLQAMQQPTASYLSMSTGRSPHFTDERWLLVRRPELVDDYNEWLVYHVDAHGRLHGPRWRCNWHGKWDPPTCTGNSACDRHTFSPPPPPACKKSEATAATYNHRYNGYSLE